MKRLDKPTPARITPLTKPHLPGIHFQQWCTGAKYVRPFTRAYAPIMHIHHPANVCTQELKKIKRGPGNPQSNKSLYFQSINFLQLQIKYLAQSCSEKNKKAIYDSNSRRNKLGFCNRNIIIACHIRCQKSYCVARAKPLFY